MSRECGTCGFLNPLDPAARADPPVCGLCGAPLPDEAEPDQPSEHPHRVPSGLVRQPGASHPEPSGTDLGLGTAPEPGPSDPTPQPREPLPASDLGEVAARTAVESGDFSTVAQPAPEPAPVEVAAAALLGRVKLVVEQGLIIGEQYLLSQAEMVIGRADVDAQSYPDIDLSGQDNDYVHRRHARLQFHDLGTRLSVEHLGGANLTLVNNEPARAGELVELFVGDRLRVGRVVMRLARM